MKKLLRTQIVILIALIMLYGVGFWLISRDQQVRSEAISSQVNPPSGMKYYEYCTGGLSETMTVSNDTGCLAERPGDFAKFALATYLTAFYIGSLVIGFGFHMYRHRHPRK